MELANVRPIQKHQAIEIKVSNIAVGKVNLPDSTILRGKKIVGIEAQHVNEVSNSPSGNALIADAVFKKTFLTLMDCQSSEDISQLPLNAIYAKNNDGRVKYFNAKVIDWTKSYILFANTTGLVADTVVLLNIYYED